MRFPHKEWNDGKSTGNYVADYRSDRNLRRSKTTWNVELQTPNAGTRSPCVWDGLAKLPQDDPFDAGRCRELAPAPALRSQFVVYVQRGRRTQTRSFQIVAEPERSLPLQHHAAHGGVPSTGATTIARHSRSAVVNVALHGIGLRPMLPYSSLSLSGRVVRHMSRRRAPTSTLDTKRPLGRQEATAGRHFRPAYVPSPISSPAPTMAPMARYQASR